MILKNNSGRMNMLRVTETEAEDPGEKGDGRTEVSEHRERGSDAETKGGVSVSLTAGTLFPLQRSGKRLAEMELGRFVGYEKNRDLEGISAPRFPIFSMK